MPRCVARFVHCAAPLSSTLDLHAALGRILDFGVEATAADFGNIQLRGSDGSLRIAVHRGFAPAFLEFFRVVKHDLSACSAVLLRGRRVVVRDVRRSRRYSEPARRAMLEAGVLACQSTPILSPSLDVTGVLSTHFRAPHTCSKEDLALIDLLAKQAGLLIRGSEVSRQRVDLVRAFGEVRAGLDRRRTRVIRGTRAKP